MRPSVGVAVGSALGDADGSAETLLKQADLAMYAAKRSQHGGVHPFTADMRMIDVSEIDPPRHRKIASRRNSSPGVQLFAQLRHAIDQGELSLVYQPKFTVSSGQRRGRGGTGAVGASRSGVCCSPTSSCRSRVRTDSWAR